MDCSQAEKLVKENQKYEFDTPGKALIINNEFKNRRLSRHTHRQIPRLGGTKDADRMEKVFKDILGEDNVEVHPNLNDTDFPETIEIFKGSCLLEKSSFCVIIFMSHGTTADTLCTDDSGTFNLYKDLVHKFNNKNFPEFKGKPKIFLIQACSGSHYEDDNEEESLVRVKDEEEHVLKPGEDGCRERESILTDVFVGRCSLPTTYSYRSEKTGAPYIQSWGEVLESQDIFNDDLVTLHNKVRTSVLNQVPQTPYHIEFGFRKFVFPRHLSK